MVSQQFAFVVSIVGHRSALKDEVVLGLLDALNHENYRCLFYKKAKEMDVDTKGKDSYELFDSGLDYISLITGKHRYIRSKQSLQYAIEKADYDCLIQQNSTENADIIVMVDACDGIKSDIRYNVLISSNNQMKGQVFSEKALPQFFYWVINKMKEKQATSCCEGSPSDLDIQQAQQKIIERCQQLQETEIVTLQSALGRVLREDLVATISNPPNDNSAMDGYGVCFAENLLGETLEVVGKSFAGSPFLGTIQKGQAVRIMTGAKIPDGVEAVVMQEQTTLSDDEKTVVLNRSVKFGQNIRKKGEDIKQGDVFLKSGTLLTPACIGVIASMGFSEVCVTRKVNVAIISTGDELQGIGTVLKDGNIYDSNRYSLGALLNDPCVNVIQKGVLSDVADDMEALFLEVAKFSDIILTTGGVSVGEADWVKPCIDKTGEMIFWRVSIKPGRPIAFAKVMNSFLFGLPGNPVSVMITYEKFARLGVDLLAGRGVQQQIEIKVKSASKIRKIPGRVEFQRGVLAYDEAGELFVKTTGDQGSGILSSMSEANCLIVLEKDAESILVGETVTVHPFSIKI